jgi:uncharacterized protein with FMN-binding domain
LAGNGGKGKLSNDLVAVSCAAVLTVYAAGYWRTRDAARRVEMQAQERRSARTAPVDTAISPAPIQPAAHLLPTSKELSANTPPQVAAAAPDIAAVTATTSLTATTAVQAPAADSSPQTLAPLEASVIEPAPAPVARDSEPVPAGNWRDGTYNGWGTSRHGDIKAQVVIRDGRIVESGVASCETRWPCDVISTIINQPVERQNADVDRVSRATESSNAYYYALVDALDDALVVPSVQATPR